MPNISHLRKTIGKYLGQPMTPEMAVEIELATHYIEDESIDPAQFGMVVHNGYAYQAERFGDILPELHLLHVEHYAETEKYRHGLPLRPDYDALHRDERAGRLIQFTVRDTAVDFCLVGNLRMYVLKSRHTSTLKAVEDTLYLHPMARGGMTAIKLMRFAETSLLSIGVREIEADSKLLNKADVLMRRMKYEPIATKFAKIFKEKKHGEAASHT